MAVPARDLMEFVCDPEAIPSIPVVALKIVRMSNDPTVGAKELVSVIEKDPALAAKTLKFANSSYYGAAQPIRSLNQAVVRLGFRTARMLALSFGIVEATTAKFTDFEFPVYWQRSLCTSVVARRLAQRSLPRLTEEVFVAALLADIGCPLLAKKFPQQYRSVTKLAENGAKRLCDIERSFLQIDHAQVGAALLSWWGLPAELALCVGAHHDLSGLQRDNPAYPVAATVMAASELTDLIINPSSLGRIEHLTALFRDFYSFKPEHVSQLVERLDSEVQEIARLMSLPDLPGTTILAKAKEEALRLAVTAGPAEGGAAGVQGPPLG